MTGWYSPEVPCRARCLGLAACQNRGLSVGDWTSKPSPMDADAVHELMEHRRPGTSDLQAVGDPLFIEKVLLNWTAPEAAHP